MNVWLEIIGALTTVLAVLGAWMNNHKFRTCFKVWLVSNSLSLACHVALTAYSLAARDAIFLGLAIHGLLVWRRPQPPAKASGWDGTDRKASDRRNGTATAIGEGRAKFCLYCPPFKGLYNTMTDSPAVAAEHMNRGYVIVMR